MATTLVWIHTPPTAEAKVFGLRSVSSSLPLSPAVRLSSTSIRTTDKPRRHRHPSGFDGSPNLSSPHLPGAVADHEDGHCGVCASGKRRIVYRSACGRLPFFWRGEVRAVVFSAYRSSEKNIFVDGALGRARLNRALLLKQPSPGVPGDPECSRTVRTSTDVRLSTTPLTREHSAGHPDGH